MGGHREHLISFLLVLEKSAMHSKRYTLKRRLNRLEHRAPGGEAAPSSVSSVSESHSTSAPTVNAAPLSSGTVAAVATVVSLLVAAILLGQCIRLGSCCRPCLDVDLVCRDRDLRV